MKKYIACLFFLSLHTLSFGESNKHVIGAWRVKFSADNSIQYPGFFGAFFGVLNNLSWAFANNKTPVIYWDQHSLYYQKEGYNGETNVWEYYFEPVSKERYEPGYDQLYCKYTNPDNRGINTFDPHFSHEYREKIYNVITRYIRIKPVIQAKIDTFYEYNMQGKKTIGLHIRGTDKNDEVDCTSPRELIRKAEEWAKAHGNDYQFLVATDEEEILALAKEFLPGPVIYWNSYRSQDKNPTHLTHDDYSPAKKGEEVLIESQLLARCDMFIHGYSNVAYAVLFFNPWLESMLVESEKFVIGPLYARTHNNTYYKAGLFAAIFSVIAHAKWCDEHHRIPVVYWDERSAFFDKNYGDNAWEYFFEPLSAHEYEKGETVHVGINALDGFEVEHPCHHSKTYRHFIHDLMNKYVRIKPSILRLVDGLYAQKIAGKPTIGIHLRGTDKRNEVIVAHTDELIAAANEAAKEFENPQFYVATDEEQLLEYAQKKLNGPVVFINAQRSKNGMPLHRFSVHHNNRHLGVEALVDALLLSRCDKLVHSHSNLSYAVTFFNPDIDDIFLERMPVKKSKEIISQKIRLDDDSLATENSNYSGDSLFFKANQREKAVKSERFVIGPVSRKVNQIDHEHYDFFSSFFSVLAQMQWCKENKRTPIVYWDHTSPYFSQSDQQNAWDYFFKPLNEAQYEEGDSVQYAHEAAHDFHIKTGIRHSYEYRYAMHKIIQENIVVQDAILEHVREIKKSMRDESPVIGIHLAHSNEHNDASNLSKIIAAANKEAARCKTCSFFIVADSPELLDFADTYLLNRTIFSLSYRPNGSPQQHAKRLLTEALLLAECDILVHPHANLSYAATFFNPKLPTVLIENVSSH